MNEPFDLSVYKETLLFLVTAGVVAPLFFRLRVSPVLGYLLAGVALGPYGLGSIDLKAPWLNALAINVDAIDRIAAFGVVTLMFTMGLELSFERLKRMRALVFGLGLAQVLVTTLFLAAAAWRLGLHAPAALAIGAALSMSSTAIVIPVLVESKRLHSGAGRASLAVLLFQDLAVAPLLVMIGATAPFVGLFGTVWGVMNSFIGISRQHTTNLAVVAPGIAEALLATALGLAAAIPAVVFYNMLARSIGGYRARYADGSAAILRLAGRDLDRARMAPAEPVRARSSVVG